jgi:hypothetical protein
LVYNAIINKWWKEFTIKIKLIILNIIKKLFK